MRGTDTGFALKSSYMNIGYEITSYMILVRDLKSLIFKKYVDLYPSSTTVRVQPPCREVSLTLFFCKADQIWFSRDKFDVLKL